MDEAKVSSVITNSNKELLYQFFLVYGFVCSLPSLLRPKWVQCLYPWWVYSCAPDGQNKDLDFRLIVLRTKLSLDYLNVLADY